MFLTEKPQAIITACAQTWYIYFYSTVLNRFPFTEGNFQPHHKPLNLPPCSLRQNKLPSQFNITLSSAAQQKKPFSFGASDNQRELTARHTALQPEPEVFFRHAAGAEKAARTARGSSQVLWDTGKVNKTPRVLRPHMLMQLSSAYSEGGPHNSAHSGNPAVSPWSHSLCDSVLRAQ